MFVRIISLPSIIALLSCFSGGSITYAQPNLTIKNPLQERVEIFVYCLQHNRYVVFPSGRSSDNHIVIAPNHDKTKPLEHKGQYQLWVRNVEGNDHFGGIFAINEDKTFIVTRAMLTGEQWVRRNRRCVQIQVRRAVYGLTEETIP